MYMYIHLFFFWKGEGGGGGSYARVIQLRRSMDDGRGVGSHFEMHTKEEIPT